MLTIIVPETEMWDEKNEEFIVKDKQILNLEHSLVSLSKWESKWQKAFLSKADKTTEETIDYIKCMTLTKNVPNEVYDRLGRNNIESINKYIENPMTATTFSNAGNRSSGRETITSELIYYWMVAQNIPFECQHWHLNRLLTLIRVCNIKNQDPKKMGKRETMSRNAALNAQRRAQMGTKG